MCVLPSSIIIDFKLKLLAKCISISVTNLKINEKKIFSFTIVCIKSYIYGIID
jgi:hypothetical protein